MSRLLVTNLSLIDVLKHYLGYSDSDFDKQGKNVYLTRCPLHDEKKGTSLALYDKTDKGYGWDWVCYGACGTGGSAPKLLVEAGLFDTIENAIKDLRTTFKLEYPDTVTVENFAEYKGLSVEFLKSRGINNHAHVRDGEVINGLGIPFYDLEGNTIAVKKRLKFEGSPKYVFTEGDNTIYGLDKLRDYTKDVLYIFEGESDTLTAMYAGLQGIGVPGANAWGACLENYPDVKQVLDEFEKIIIVPDQDSAGKKLVKAISASYPDNVYTVRLPKRFKDVNDYYLYGCGGNKEALYEYFTTCTLIPATPNAFKTALKQDLSMLSCYDAWFATFDVLQDEVKIMLFVEELKAELKCSKTVIGKGYSEAYKRYNKFKDEKTESDSDIYIKGKSYYKSVYSDGMPVEIPISNFIIHLLHTIEADGNHVRVCRLENELGQVSRQVIFTSETLTKPIDFMTECKNAGNYIYKGDFKDLIALNEMLLKQEGDIVHSPDHIGRVGDVWIMGRYGVDSRGQIVDADENNILVLDGSRYMVRNLNIVDDADETYMPTKPDDLITIDDDYLKDVAYTLKDNLGTYAAWLALGFTVAGWHSNEIYNHNNDKSYPIFFIHGKRNSGKTYLARWLMSAYGFPHIDGKNFAMPSVVSMTRKLGYYSSLPSWYDDYKNDIKDIKYRDEFLLGVYNRQGADKGTKSGFGVRSEKIRGMLLISGEDTPDNNAVYSRCCNIQVSAYERNDDKLNHMLELVQHFPSMGLHFLADKQRNGSKALLERIDKIQGYLMSTGIDGRLAKNYAVYAAGFLHAFGHIISEADTKEFMNWLEENAKRTKETTENDHIVSRFFSDLTVLMMDGKIVNGKHFKVEGNKIYMWFKGCYDAWCDNYKVDIKRTVLLDYIQKEPFFIRHNERKRLGAESSQIRCLVLDYTLIQDSDFREICASCDDDNLEF